ALVANVQLSNFNFLFRTESRFFERDLHVVPQIRTTLSILGVPAHAAKEGFENGSTDSAATAAENFAENVEWIVESPAKSPALLKRGVTEAIVGGALVRIHEHVVRFAQLLEFFFGVRVVRIFVRMKLDRELAISALHLLSRRVSRHAKDLVVIAFLCRRH